MAEVVEIGEQVNFGLGSLFETLGYHFARGYSRGVLGPTARQIVGREAQVATAELVLAQMGEAFWAEDRSEIWRSGLDRTSGPPGEGNQCGLILEFGVWRGDSLTWLAKNSRQVVHGFDTFNGLQEDWAGVHPKGYFAVNSLPKVPSNARLIVGRAQETLPKFLQEHKEDIRLVHLDMDTYQSTLDVLRLLHPRLVSGSVIVFDELVGYSLWQQGEYRAWSEFVAEAQIPYRYFATTGVQVGIEIL